jgi:ABC-type nitrate/sulfonate/bicarbonate transport system substrate-binding protein
MKPCIGFVRACVAALLVVTAAVANAQPLKEVKLALSFPNGAAWPYLAVAEEMGYFRDEGHDHQPERCVGVVQGDGDGPGRLRVLGTGAGVERTRRR